MAISPVSNSHLLVIMDSRGANLQELIENKGVSVKVEVLRGYKLEEAAELIMIKPRVRTPDVVMVGAGICNITTMQKHPRQVVLTNTDTLTVVHNYNRAMWEAYGAIHSKYPMAKVNFATLYGIDLANYNYTNYKSLVGDDLHNYLAAKIRHKQQDAMDDIIQAVNIEIQKVNTELGITTAWTGNCVHKYYQHRYHHNYSKLIDGCHPNESALEAYATQIVKAFKKIMLRI